MYHAQDYPPSKRFYSFALLIVHNSTGDISVSYQGMWVAFRTLRWVTATNRGKSKAYILILLNNPFSPPREVKQQPSCVHKKRTTSISSRTPSRKKLPMQEGALTPPPKTCLQNKGTSQGQGTRNHTWRFVSPSSGDCQVGGGRRRSGSDWSGARDHWWAHSRRGDGGWADSWWIGGGCAGCGINSSSNGNVGGGTTDAGA